MVSSGKPFCDGNCETISLIALRDLALIVASTTAVQWLIYYTGERKGKISQVLRGKTYHKEGGYYIQ